MFKQISVHVNDRVLSVTTSIKSARVIVTEFSLGEDNLKLPVDQAQLEAVMAKRLSLSGERTPEQVAKARTDFLEVARQHEEWVKRLSVVDGRKGKASIFRKMVLFYVDQTPAGYEVCPNDQHGNYVFQPKLDAAGKPVVFTADSLEDAARIILEAIGQNTLA